MGLTRNWYLENFDAMNITPKQKYPVYRKYINLALQENKLSEHERLNLIKDIDDAFEESLRHE